jgi:hypothetical protein
MAEAIQYMSRRKQKFIVAILNSIRDIKKHSAFGLRVAGLPTNVQTYIVLGL